ncbi:MAG: patatin-like phospholipase family protein, partial [Acidimicrobiales bacterium]
MKTIENLVFKGGGVLGAAYVGAYQALQEARLAGVINNSPVGNVERVAGTSAGSIFGTLVALGHSAEKIKGIMTDPTMDFWSFVDFDFSTDALARGGLCKGAAFRKWMNDTVVSGIKELGETPSAEPTFEELAGLRDRHPVCKDLHVFARNVETSMTREFSAQTTPTVPIAQAVRASMSIPFFFEPWRFSDALAEAYPGRFIDGGVAYNYPISDFDSDDNLQKTLGFFLMDMSYREQSVLQTVFHGVLRGLGAGPWLTPVAEDLFYVLLDLASSQKIDPKTISSDTLKGVITQLPGAPSDPSDLEVLADVLFLIGALVFIYAEWSTYSYTTEWLMEQLKDFLHWIETKIGGNLAKVLGYILPLGDVLGATINPPAN